MDTKVSNATEKPYVFMVDYEPRKRPLKLMANDCFVIKKEKENYYLRCKIEQPTSLFKMVVL